VYFSFETDAHGWASGDRNWKVCDLFEDKEEDSLFFQAEIGKDGDCALRVGRLDVHSGGRAINIFLAKNQVIGLRDLLDVAIKNSAPDEVAD
jgi:hypothetical protein